MNLAQLLERTATSLPGTLAVLAAASLIAVTVAVRAFGMSVVGATSVYFVIWWTLLFAVLSYRAQSQAEAGEIVPGSDPGAPALPRLREKAILTTLVAGLALVLAALLLPLAGI